jgi:hypothetical protein
MTISGAHPGNNSSPSVGPCIYYFNVENMLKFYLSAQALPAAPIIPMLSKKLNRNVCSVMCSATFFVLLFHI